MATKDANGKVIADKIDNHHMLEFLYKGMGDKRMQQVREMYRSNKDYLNDLNRYWMNILVNFQIKI